MAIGERAQKALDGAAATAAAVKQRVAEMQQKFASSDVAADLQALAGDIDTLVADIQEAVTAAGEGDEPQPAAEA